MTGLDHDDLPDDEDVAYDADLRPEPVFDDPRLSLLDHATFRRQSQALRDVLAGLGIAAAAEVCDDLTAVAYQRPNAFHLMGHIRDKVAVRPWNPIRLSNILAKPEMDFGLTGEQASEIADRKMFAIDPDRPGLMSLRSIIDSEPHISSVQIMDFAGGSKGLRSIARKLGSQGIETFGQLAERGYHLDRIQMAVVLGRLIPPMRRSLLPEDHPEHQRPKGPKPKKPKPVRTKPELSPAPCIHLDRQHDLFLLDRNGRTYRWYRRGLFKDHLHAAAHLTSKTDRQPDKIPALCRIAYGETTMEDEGLTPDDVYRTDAELGKA